MDGIELPEGIALDDPRPIAAGAIYTFFLPHADEIAALEPGDWVQTIFRECAGGREFDAERMWSKVERVEDGFISGFLDTDPSDMPSIRRGDRVRIPLSHLINIAYREGKAGPVVPLVREFWDRCLVDACVAEGRSHVDYLYREEPNMAQEGDRYPDSGWRLRGTPEAIADDEERGEKLEYIALAAVLNKDDRWMHLIDREAGCTFQWDAASEDYMELK